MLKSTIPQKCQCEEKQEKDQLGKCPKLGETRSSRMTIMGKPRQLDTSVQEMLVLPPMPVDIFHELTSMFNGLDSTDSATEPETDMDEAETRKGASNK